jgi:prefoldin subunit 5
MAGPRLGPALPSALSEAQELSALKQQAESLDRALSALKSRIQHLDRKTSDATGREPT